MYCATVECDRGNGSGASGEIYGALSTKTFYGRLRESCNHWSNWRDPWCWWSWKLYDNTRLFFSVNFIYLRSMGRDEVRVDNSLSFVIESKFWWCSSDINPSIFHLLFVHCKIIFVTELLPTAICIDSTFGSKLIMHYCNLVCILLVELNLFLDRTATIP